MLVDSFIDKTTEKYKTKKKLLIGIITTEKDKIHEENVIDFFFFFLNPK